MMDMHGCPLEIGDRVTVAASDTIEAVLTGAHGIVVDFTNDRVDVMLRSPKISDEEGVTVSLSPEHLACPHLSPAQPSISFFEILDTFGRALTEDAIATAVADHTMSFDQGEKLIKIWREQVVSAVSSLQS
ncbi:hypothetical protein ACWEO2_44150 [Nocardia sp. NPDC004278]